MEDADAFAELYRHEGEAVLIFLTRRTFDAETALELTAETFAIAMRPWGRRRSRSKADDRRPRRCLPRGARRARGSARAQADGAPARRSHAHLRPLDEPARLPLEPLRA